MSRKRMSFCLVNQFYAATAHGQERSQLYNRMQCMKLKLIIISQTENEKYNLPMLHLISNLQYT